MSFIPKNVVKGYEVEDTVYGNEDDAFLVVGQENDHEIYWFKNTHFPDQICMKVHVDYDLCLEDQCSIDQDDLQGNENQPYKMLGEKEQFFVKSLRIHCQEEIQSRTGKKDWRFSDNPDYVFDALNWDKEFQCMAGSVSTQSVPFFPIGGGILGDHHSTADLFNIEQKNAKFVINPMDSEWDVFFESSGPSVREEVEKGYFKMRLFFKKDPMSYRSISVQDFGQNGIGIIFEKELQHDAGNSLISADAKDEPHQNQKGE